MSLERRLAILSLIPHEPRTITVKQLTAKLRDELRIDCEERSVQRDMQKLHELFKLDVIYTEENAPSKSSVDRHSSPAKKKTSANQTRYWSISKGSTGLEIPRMDPAAATVLKLAEKYLHGLLPEAVLENIDYYFQRASAVLDKPGRPRGWLDAVAMVPKALPLLPPDYDRSIADTVFQAIKDNRQLRVSSITRNSPDQPREYVINPLGIVLRDTSIYLVWSGAGDREERVKEFALHRIRSASILNVARDLPEGFSLENFIHEQQGFGYLVQGEPEDIQLVMEVSPTLRFTLSETALSKDQVIERLDENRYRVTATVKNTHQLRAWIREKGTQATVIAPDCVRDDLIAQFRTLVRQYETE